MFKAGTRTSKNPWPVPILLRQVGSEAVDGASFVRGTNRNSFQVVPRQARVSDDRARPSATTGYVTVGIRRNSSVRSLPGRYCCNESRRTM